MKRKKFEGQLLGKFEEPFFKPGKYGYQQKNLIMKYHLITNGILILRGFLIFFPAEQKVCFD